jgi:hypothetical protein
MAADVGKVYPPEVHLLKKELEVQGELLTQERLDRKAEVDRLRLELDTLKRLFEESEPGFLKRFDRLYAQETRTWDPELERKEA